MAWQIEFGSKVEKDLKKLGVEARRRIIEYLESRLIERKLEPRQFGEALLGDKAGLWKYRVGDYRIVCSIEDERLVVLVVLVDHRKQVYKKKPRK